MIPIKIEVKGLEELYANLDDLIKHRIPKITALALTATAKDVVKDSQEKMKQVFDRPTPFILRSQWIKAATKEDPTASVEWKERAGKGVRQWDAATRTLSPHVEGIGRELKGFEATLRKKGILPSGLYAVPGKGADIDTYGNMSRGQIIHLISYFNAFPEAGYRANMGEKKRARLAKGSVRTGKLGFVYFVGRPGNGQLPLGIYKRTGYFGRKLLPIIIFTRQPRYRKRWDIHDDAQQVVDRQFPKNFKRIADETLSFWRNK